MTDRRYACARARGGRVRFQETVITAVGGRTHHGRRSAVPPGCPERNPRDDPDLAGLARAGLNRTHENGFSRLVIEKPYGANLATARQLDATVHAAFDEPQVFRIDHYLGKDTVQNVLALRFANSIFQPIWNRSWV